MANKQTWFGMFVFGLAAGLLLSGCPNLTGEEEDGGTGSAAELSEGEWKDGSITKDGQAREYSISVSEGAYYFIWWNDSYSGNGTKTTDVYVSARYSDGTTLFTKEDSAWNTPKLIVSDRNGKLFLSVSGGTGSFAIRYTSRAGAADGLSEDVWKSDNLITNGQTNEYSVSVTSGAYYFIWWNDSYSGNGTKTADVYVSARYSDGTTLFTREDSAWNTPKLIVSDRNGTLILNVSGGIGTYEIRYTARPGGATALSEGIWENDRLIANGQINYYSINVTSGTTYYIWWNDSYSGNGTKTTDVYVSAQYSGGDSIFTRADSAWSAPASFTAGINGTVVLIVSGGTGTYAVAYRTANSRP